MKLCPFCAEEIQDAALKCKHCGEFLDHRPPEKAEEKWYLKTHFLVGAFLTLGPLALPLLWIHPKYSQTHKIVVSVIVIGVSYFLIKAVMGAMQSISQYYELLM